MTNLQFLGQSEKASRFHDADILDEDTREYLREYLRGVKRVKRVKTSRPKQYQTQHERGLRASEEMVQARIEQVERAYRSVGGYIDDIFADESVPLLSFEKGGK